MMPGVVAAQIIQFVGFAASAGGGTAETQTMFAVASMIVSWMCTVLLQWPAQAGLFAAATQASRGRVQDFRAIFAGFRRFGTVVFASLILSVVGVLVASPILVVAWDALWPWAQTGFQTMPDLAAINIPLTLAVGAGCADECRAECGDHSDVGEALVGGDRGGSEAVEDGVKPGEDGDGEGGGIEEPPEARLGERGGAAPPDDGKEDE